MYNLCIFVGRSFNHFTFKLSRENESSVIQSTGPHTYQIISGEDELLSHFNFATINYSRIVTITIPKLMIVTINRHHVAIKCTADLSSHDISIETNYKLKIQKLFANNVILNAKSTEIDILKTTSLNIKYLVIVNSVIQTQSITGNGTVMNKGCIYINGKITVDYLLSCEHSLIIANYVYMTSSGTNMSESSVNDSTIYSPVAVVNDKFIPANNTIINPLTTNNDEIVSKYDFITNDQHMDASSNTDINGSNSVKDDINLNNKQNVNQSESSSRVQNFTNDDYMSPTQTVRSTINKVYLTPKDKLIAKNILRFGTSKYRFSSYNIYFKFTHYHRYVYNKRTRFKNNYIIKRTRAFNQRIKSPVTSDPVIAISNNVSYYMTNYNFNTSSISQCMKHNKSGWPLRLELQLCLSGG